MRWRATCAPRPAGTHSRTAPVDEESFIAALRTLPLHPGARDLRDDAARLRGLVLTSDMIAEGVHFLPTDPPGDVAWKLVATNLSDLAAKGAAPVGMMTARSSAVCAMRRNAGNGRCSAATRCGCPPAPRGCYRSPRSVMPRAVPRAAAHAPAMRCG